MNSYERLLDKTEQNHITVLEKQFKSNAKGLCKGNKIAICRDITSVEKAVILAEELGHYYTTTGNILNQESENCRKQERKARIWAYNTLIGLSGITDAFAHGCCSLYEMAEYLEVSEAFFKDSICYYREKYGCRVSYNGYLILFEPVFTVSDCCGKSFAADF